MTQYWKGHPHPMQGTHRSEETKKKVSETRKRLGLSSGKNNPNAKKVYCIEIDKHFGCIKDAADFLDRNYNTLKSHLGETYKGYTLVYEEDLL